MSIETLTTCYRCRKSYICAFEGDYCSCDPTTNFTRDILADFFANFDDTYLLYLDFLSVEECNSLDFDLVDCLRDPKYKKQNEVVEFLNRMIGSSFADELFMIFGEYREKRGLPEHDEVLTIQIVINCINDREEKTVKSAKKEKKIVGFH
jgi:hypothetical protein